MKKNEPIRIAHIIGKWLGGGVEAVVMNYYRHIDRNKIQFDFICDEDSTDIPYKEIESLGGRVILIPPYQKIFKYHKQLKKVLREGNYKIVHSHINALSVFSLWAAKSAKVPVRIAHSHSTSNKKEWKKNLIKNILKPFSKKYATQYFACTEHAGRWLFGKKTYNSGKVYVLNNAIDIDNYKFNGKIRKQIRKELNFKDTDIVIGHIGRFVEQKNHRFLIDVFHELYERNENYKLMLIGQGPLQEEMKQKVKDLGLEKAVTFLGQKTDAYNYYNAMDLFLFPSLYEGLGMVFIEAQVSGIPTIGSTEVPEIAKVSDNAIFIDLNKSIREWVRRIDAVATNKRNTDLDEIRNRGYDIKIEAEKLENTYLNMVIHIELFGLPGCGKSMYYTDNLPYMINLNKKLQSKSRLVRNIKRIIYYAILNIKHRKKAKKIKTLIKKANFSSKKVMLKMKLYLSSIVYLIERYRNTSYMLEEGLIQCLWAVCYNSDYNEEYIEAFLATFSDILPQRVIHINVEEKDIIERLKARTNKGGSELEHDIKRDSKKIELAKLIEKSIMDKVNKNVKMDVI